MPNPVYMFSLRGRNLGNELRVKDEAAAYSLYNKVKEAIERKADIVELELDNNTAAIRTADISGFGVSTYMEPTPEELREQAHAQIEAQFSRSEGAAMLPYSDYPNQCAKANAIGYVGNGRIL